MEGEVKGISQKLKSEYSLIEYIRKLNDQFSRDKNQCPGVPGRGIIKMYGIKISLIINKNFFKLKKKKILHIERGLVKTQHSTCKKI